MLTPATIDYHSNKTVSFIVDQYAVLDAFGKSY
jgi:hypothetical protein